MALNVAAFEGSSDGPSPRSAFALLELEGDGVPPISQLIKASVLTQVCHAKPSPDRQKGCKAAAGFCLADCGPTPRDLDLRTMAYEQPLFTAARAAATGDAASAAAAATAAKAAARAAAASAAARVVAVSYVQPAAAAAAPMAAAPSAVQQPVRAAKPSGGAPSQQLMIAQSSPKLARAVQEPLTAVPSAWAPVLPAWAAAAGATAEAAARQWWWKTTQVPHPLRPKAAPMPPDVAARLRLWIGMGRLRSNFGQTFDPMRPKGLVMLKTGTLAASSGGGSGKVNRLRCQFESLGGISPTSPLSPMASFEEADSHRRAAEALSICRGKVKEARPRIEGLCCCGGSPTASEAPAPCKRSDSSSGAAAAAAGAPVTVDVCAFPACGTQAVLGGANGLSALLPGTV